MKDSNGNEVKVGDRIRFSYGIPPVKVVGLVCRRKRELVVLTPGHNPPECPLRWLKDLVGEWWKEKETEEEKAGKGSGPGDCL